MKRNVALKIYLDKKGEIKGKFQHLMMVELEITIG